MGFFLLFCVTSLWTFFYYKHSLPCDSDGPKETEQFLKLWAYEMY